MKKSSKKKSDDTIRGFPITSVRDGWFFRIDEISQGYYRVTGIDRWGRTVSRDGIDPDQLLQLCKHDIEDISSGEKG